MNQYLLAVHGAEGEALPSPEVIQKMHADVDALNQVMQREGAWVFAG